MQEMWADFRSALQKQDVASALECMHTKVRELYQKILPEVLTSGTPISEILPDIRFEHLLGGRANFEMVRTEPEGQISYLVEFELDIDGVWRLRFM